MTDTRTAAAPAALLEPSDHHPPHPQVPDHAVTPDGRIRYHLVARNRGGDNPHDGVAVALRSAAEAPAVKNALRRALADTECGRDHLIRRATRQYPDGAHAPLRWSVGIICFPPDTAAIDPNDLEPAWITDGILRPVDADAATEWVTACAELVAERAATIYYDQAVRRIRAEAQAVGMTPDELLTETRTLAGALRVAETDEWQNHIRAGGR